MSSPLMPSNAEVYAMCGLTPEQIAEIESPSRVTPIDRDKEVGQPLLIDFVFDASGSMQDWYATLVQEFNTTMLGSLRGVDSRQSNVLRLGGLLYGTGFSHIWPGFRSLTELGAEPLKTEFFYRPELGSLTALYSAMIRGLLWTQRAVQKFAREEKRTARGIVIVLTDGANNQKPLMPGPVVQIIQDIRKEGTIITPYLAYFKTTDGLSESASKELAKSTGFKHLGYFDITSLTGNQEEREQKFRHHFNLFSQKVVAATA